jgi:hypothetical protein
MDIINTNLNVQKISDPYDIWIIDNFLKEHTLKGIKDAWPSYENDAWYVGHPEIDGKKNILEQGMLGISKVGEMPEFISNVMSYIHTKEF